MVNAFIRSMIGSWGNGVLDFYIANSLWINGVLLIYALMVVLSRRNFDSSVQSLILLLKKRYGEQLTKKGPGSQLSFLKKSNIPWGEVLSNSALPFITPPGSIWVYPKSIENFQKLMPLEKLVDHLVQQVKSPH